MDFQWIFALILLLNLKDRITDTPKTPVSNKATRDATGRVNSKPAQTPNALTDRAMSGVAANMLFTLEQNWLAMDAGVTSSTKIKMPPTMSRLSAMEMAMMKGRM